MFSLQKLLGKEDKFFDLLEASAVEARSSVHALLELQKLSSASDLLETFATSRRNDKKITEQISEHLVTTFVTALEREDIEALSNALYKIPKTVEKFAEHYSVSASHVQSFDFSKQAGMLDQATAVVVEMVRSLRKQVDLQQIKELNARLQRIEGDADKWMLELLRDLYSGDYQPLQVIIIRDLSELLEKVVDRCRDAGNVVSHIVLKNS